MSDRTALPIVDEELASQIEHYPDTFWQSSDRDRREGIHAYFQYPAMMVPALQRELVGLVVKLQPMVESVLDPFVGAGTTMTACMPLGLDFVGQDINPLAVLVSRAKRGPFFHKALASKIGRVLERIDADHTERIDAGPPNIDKWFQLQTQIELGRIRRAISLESTKWARRFLWVALAETVRLTSNSRTSTFKLHVRTAEDIGSRRISAIEVFETVLSQNLEDMKGFSESLAAAGCLRRGHYCGRLAIRLQDSARKIQKPAGDSKWHDLLITSSPYGDNTSTVTYGQHSYLPLQWVDLEDIDGSVKAEDWLRSTSEIDRRSLGGHKPRDLQRHVAHMEARSTSFRNTVAALREQKRDRTSRVTAFVGDLDRALDPIVQSLKTNAYLIWTIGNRHVGGLEIPTDKILTELLARRGVEPVSRVARKMVFRRMAARNQISSMMREEHILVFRKAGEP